MSLLNFPINPTLGQRYTIGKNIWEWNGSAWIKIENLDKNFNFVTATNVFVSSTTVAISTTSGALVVAGGVGIGGDLYVGGTFYAGGEVVLTTASFAYSLTEGDDIKITLSSSTGFLVFSNTSTLQTVTDRGNITNNQILITNLTESTSTFSGALIVSGGIGVGGNTYIEGRVDCESVKIEDAVFDSTMVTLSNNITTVIDTYSLNQYRAAKYFIQISDGSGDSAEFQAQEITVIASNTGTVDISAYGLVTTNGPTGVGNFDAIVESNEVKLRFTPHFASLKTIRVLRTAMSR
jgi:cytoskeletal protein CcmA (bactofilin family)